MDPNPREYERQAIDAEIQSLEESIRALKHRRNALAPISSLPTEVFTAIFSFSRITSTFITPGEMIDSLAWLRVAHVCHHWREIAINQPLFWSHVNFTTLSSAGTAEILARSKTAPLYLEARILGSHWDNSRCSRFQEGLQVWVSRIRHLHISAKIYDLRKILDSLVSPAPNLKSISLSSKRQLRQPDVPDALFGGAMPRLTCLELRNCNISWNSPLLKGLQILEMCFPSMTVIPSLPVWLDALDEMPQLKMLTLRAASPEAFPFPFDVERIVTLPSLTHLDITDSMQDCAFALAHLELPALTCLCLQTYSNQNDHNLEEVLPYVVQHVHTQPLQSMLFRCKNRQIDILAWPVPNIDVGPTLSNGMPPALIALSIKGRDSIYYCLEVVGAVIVALPLDDLVTLIAQDFIPLSFGKSWRYSSVRWPLLRRVRLTPTVVTKFTDRLLKDNGECENPLLPSLEELVLVDARLDEYWIHDLCDALMKRVEQGVPLRMLDLRTCSPHMANPRTVRLLSEIVVDVMGPEETPDARAQILSTWDRLDQGPFKPDNFEEDPFAADDDDDDDEDDNDDDDDDDDDNVDD